MQPATKIMVLALIANILWIAEKPAPATPETPILKQIQSVHEVPPVDLTLHTLRVIPAPTVGNPPDTYQPTNITTESVPTVEEPKFTEPTIPAKSQGSIQYVTYNAGDCASGSCGVFAGGRRVGAVARAPFRAGRWLVQHRPRPLARLFGRR